MASTNTTSIGYLKETTTPGVIEATPLFQLLPVTSSSLTKNITTATSEVIRDDRQTDDLTVVDADVSGDIGFELSYAPWKPLMIALLQNEGQSTTVSEITTVDADYAASTFGATGIGTDRAVGDSVYISSSTDSDIDGTYTITTVTGTLLTVTPAPRGTADASDCVVRENIIHKNGALVPNSYTFRSVYQNDAGTPYYFYSAGCQVSSMAFTFSTGSILTATMSVIGLSEISQSTLYDSDPTPTVIPAYTIMNSVTSVGSISIDGVSTGTCKFSSLSLTVDNNINKASSIGVLGACALASYSLNVTGNIEIYFNNLEAYAKFQAAESFSIGLSLEDGDKNMIAINLKTCKFESLTHPVSGRDQFLMESGTFRSLRDTAGNSMVEFTFSDV